MKQNQFPNEENKDYLDPMAEHSFAPARIKHIIFMALAVIALSLFYTLWNAFTWDIGLTIFLLDLIFFSMVVLLLESQRLQGYLSHRTTDYHEFCLIFVICVILYGIFSFLPSYYAPIMVPVILLAGASNSMVGLVCGMYLNLLLCLVSLAGYHELAAYTLLTLCSVILAIWLDKKQYRIYLTLVILVLSITVPALFYYLGCYEKNDNIFIYGSISGMINCLVILLCYDKLKRRSVMGWSRSLQEVLSPQFPLVMSIRDYSKEAYRHAVEVSNLAYECAMAIDGQAQVAASAGFYYRLGFMEGEPYVKNGVLLAKNYCFPTEIISILSEYEGIEKKPSTRESAIVHLVDHVVEEFEKVQKELNNGKINSDLLVYQITNDLSSTGIYDESGLSMNQFFMVRDCILNGVTKL